MNCNLDRRLNVDIFVVVILIAVAHTSTIDITITVCNCSQLKMTQCHYYKICNRTVQWYKRFKTISAWNIKDLCAVVPEVSHQSISEILRLTHARLNLVTAVDVKMLKWCLFDRLRELYIKMVKGEYRQKTDV